MVVDGGTYTSNGVGSPAIYSTADISVNNATLTANGSEAICIEGLNSIHLFDSDLTGNMSDDDQNDCTWNVILYQSMSGDSEVGNRRTEAVSSVLKVGNISLDCTTFELKSLADTIRLPNKEFQIMELLAANPGQVISTERFMEKIWGYDSEADVGVVWVYISYLRKRLTVLGANVKIKVARGQGYYLEIQS